MYKIANFWIFMWTASSSAHSNNLKLMNILKTY